MITVSSCGVKLQEVLSSFEAKLTRALLNIHSFIHSFIHYYFFLSTWRVASSVELTLASVACGSLAGSLLLYFTVLGFCLLVTSFPLLLVNTSRLLFTVSSM